MYSANALVAYLVTVVVTLPPCSPLLPGQKTFTLEELVPLQPNFYADRLNVQWLSDSEYLHRDLAGGGIKKFDAATGVFTTLVDEATLSTLSNYSVGAFSDDVKYLLLQAHKKKIYRYSSIAEYLVFDLQKKTVVKLCPDPLQVVVWGQGSQLAYVRDNNVHYVLDAANPESGRQLTVEGVPGEVYFGVADWIYEEEVLKASEALWFSPKGTFLALASYNDTTVESAVYPHYGSPMGLEHQYPDLVQFKYPKAGRANPVVGLRVYRVNEPESNPLSIPAPVDVVGADYILGRVSWASDHSLIVLWLNRKQNVTILVNCDLKDNRCNIVRQQTEANGWIDSDQPFFDDSGNFMVEVQPLYHGHRRFLHVGKLDLNHATVEDLSPGDATVTEVLGWNQALDTVYYIASPAQTPWQRQLWASTGEAARCVSCGQPACHHVSASFSPGASYGVVTCSATLQPPKYFLFNTQDESLKLVKDNARLARKLSEYALPMPLFSVLPLSEGVTAHVKLLLPPNMQPRAKYPMILRVYAGPGTTRVKDSFDYEYYNLYLANNRSAIVASIDVRGSGVMGVEALHAVNNALGTVEISDTLAAVQRLVELYPFIDSGRVGVWGWSYGGYTSGLMLARDSRRALACAAAVAPVTSWLYYDTIYTERYMDTPQNNPDGYKRSELLAEAENLRGRKFLLIHGTGDDNVHHQHSLQLAKLLQHADIEFEQMSYTDEDHSLFRVSRHFYHTLDHFWTDCFFHEP